MHATEESAHRAIRMSTIVDSDERCKRLGQTYRLLIDLAPKKEGRQPEHIECGRATTRPMQGIPMPDTTYYILGHVKGAEVGVQPTLEGQDIFIQHGDLGQRLACLLALRKAVKRNKPLRATARSVAEVATPLIPDGPAACPGAQPGDFAEIFG